MSDSDSDLEYVPGLGDNDDSDEIDDCEYDSDDNLAGDVEPVTDQGWRFMGDPFSDSCPELLTLFVAAAGDADPAIVYTPTVPSFSSPKDAFMHIFDSDVMDSLCLWMNERADKYIAETGKCKINGVVWAAVTRADKYVFVSLLMSMGVHKLPRIYKHWARSFAYSDRMRFTSEVMT